MRAQYILEPCQRCGTMMKLSPSHVGRKKWCSRACQRPGRVTLTCIECGKQYEKFPSQVERSNFCSRECNGKHQGRVQTENATITRSCKVCGKSFQTKGQHGGKITCSKECANVAQGQNNRPRTKETIACAICGTMFERFPSRTMTKCCSRKCSNEHQSQTQTGKRHNALTVPCANCGEMVTKPRCRIERAGQTFCNNACYHAWDKRYKGTVEMREITAQRISDGTFASPSRVEDCVAAWLDLNGITYERQVRIAFRTVDFQCGDTTIEVHGCYWHGCPIHRPELNASQIKRQSRDKEIATLCQKRGFSLLVIWEHDVKSGNWEPLAPLLDH